MKLTPSQLKSTLVELIKINQENQEKNNWVPITFEIKGIHGLGKTSIVKKIAKQLELNFVKYNAAQISDAGDLTGRPTEEYECCLDLGECIWITDKLVESYKALGYEFTGNTRTGYAKPQWLTGLNESKGGILLLDDWTRAHGDVLQAVMELMLDQQYVSWKLPQGWTIVLTSNPEVDRDSNNHYNVTQTDKAQSTRYLSFELKFDIKDWVIEATEMNIHEDMISFASMHPEFLTAMSPRLFTIFAQMVTDKTINNKELMLYLASSTGHDSLAPAIEIFLKEERKSIIGIEDIFSTVIPVKTIISRIKEFTQPDGNRDAAREYILGVRIFNHVKQHPDDKSMLKRLAEILNAEIIEPDKTYSLFSELDGKQKNSAELLASYVEAIKTM